MEMIQSLIGLKDEKRGSADVALDFQVLLQLWKYWCGYELETEVS